MAYTRRSTDRNIWRIPLKGAGGRAGPPAPFIQSTRDEWAAQYSPNGSRIAFVSNRSGQRAIWLSDADGTNAVELFSKPGQHLGSPRWSPDSKRLAFDLTIEGNSDIFVIDSAGGRPERFTEDPAPDVVPSWSRDGNWVYFSSDRTGKFEVWKVAVGGGPAVQITKEGGSAGIESPGGEFVYFQKPVAGDRDRELMRLSEAGEERKIIGQVYERHFAVTERGIYFIAGPKRGEQWILRFLDFAAGSDEIVAALPGVPMLNLAISPDGQWALYSQSDDTGSDLMLVEDFR